MPGLLDIAPSKIVATLASGETVPTPGISAKGIAVLLSRFPVARQMLTGKTPMLGFDELVELAPDAVAAFIAAGCGEPGNEKAEAIAAGLTLQDQFTVCEKIIEATMPGGLTPFLERLERVKAAIPDVAAPTSIQDTKSPQASSS